MEGSESMRGRRRIGIKVVLLTKGRRRMHKSGSSRRMGIFPDGKPEDVAKLRILGIGAKRDKGQGRSRGLEIRGDSVNKVGRPDETLRRMLIEVIDDRLDILKRGNGVGRERRRIGVFIGLEIGGGAKNGDPFGIIRKSMRKCRRVVLIDQRNVEDLEKVSPGKRLI